MIKFVFDTNILLDYMGCSASQEDQDNAVALISALAKQHVPFLVTPTTLKDFSYILGSQIKKQIREEKGSVSAQDAAVVQRYLEGTLESVIEFGTVASESLAHCEMARTLCKQHTDYEDNLIAAVALSADATAIVTRDKAFAKHCPVKCCTPAEALEYLELGIWK